jgi:hypothetical protein
MGAIPTFNPMSNPPSSGWRNQPGEQASSQVLSYTPTSSMPILKNTFGMTNPPLSPGFPPKGGHFHALGNPQPGSNPARGSFYNLQKNIPTGMMPNQHFMNQPRGGSYNPGQRHGTYQNPRCVAVPQAHSFSGAWGQMPQPRLPFLATLNIPYFSKLMNDPVSHDTTWPPIPTKLPSNIPKFEGKNGEHPGDHITTFHLWCSSNCLNDISIWLIFFQCTLITVTVKWYIKLPRGEYGTFS